MDFTSLCVCSTIDHRRCQNVVTRTVSVTFPEVAFDGVVTRCALPQHESLLAG